MANWSSQELPQLYGQGGNQSLGRMERGWGWSGVGPGLWVGLGLGWGWVGVTECQLTIVAKLLVELRQTVAAVLF